MLNKEALAPKTKTIIKTISEIPQGSPWRHELRCEPIDSYINHQLSQEHIRFSDKHIWGLLTDA